MGFFSGTKKVQVSSVVYNLAGDEAKRPNYLKSLVVQNVLSDTKATIADSIVSGELNGPGIKLRQFYRWAAYPGPEDHYQFIGLCSGNLGGLGSISDDLVTTAVTQAVAPQPNQALTVQEAAAGPADYSFWAEQWMAQNHPDLFDGDWSAEFASAVGTNQITVTLPDGTQQTFQPMGFDPQAEFFYATYTVETTTTQEVPTDPPGTNPDGSPTTTTQTSKETTGPFVYIYRIGSGNAALDSLAAAKTNAGGFFPMIPVRINSIFLSEGYFKDAYHEAQRAYKRATGSKLDDLIGKISQNKSLKDIDYAYVTFGVSLNVLENSCRRYLYQFFHLLMQGQRGGPSAGPSVGTGANHGVGGINSVQIKNTGAFFTGFDFRIEWASIVEGSGIGRPKEDAKIGDLWFETITAGAPGGSGKTEYFSGQGSQVRLYWQVGQNAYKYLDLYSLVHRNYIYQNYAVVISAPEALADNKESGFIVPLHYETFRQTPLVHATQMSTACVFIVFNCFQVHKQQWYETGFFQVIIVVAIAILSAVFTGGTTIGLLGTALSVGTSLGFTGLTAAIVGSVVNALAALVLVTVIEKATTAIFGPVIGQILAVILTIAVTNISSNFFSSGDLTLSWGDLMKPDNLLKITQSIGNAYVTDMQLQIKKIGQESAAYQASVDSQLHQIEQQYIKDFGFSLGMIDPLMFLSSNQEAMSDGPVPEGPQAFLTRTLLTGSDIADLGHDMLSNFAEYTLKLPDAFTQ